MATHYAATHGDRFGRMEVGTYQGDPMHLFAYWQAGTDKKGRPIVYLTGHWAGGATPLDGYTILGEWDDAAQARFEAGRQALRAEHGVTDEATPEATGQRKTKPRPVNRARALEREGGQMRLF